MSLRLTMILGIGAILLLVILVYAVITLRSQAKHLVDFTRSEAKLIAAVTERAIARAMMDGKSEEVQTIIEQIAEVPHLAGIRIRILDPDGAILRSSKPEELGHILAEGAWPPEGTALEPNWNYQDRTVGISSPILNRPACSTCHARDRTTLGFLHVRLPFPSIQSQMIHQWPTMILPAVFALIATGGLIAMYFTLVLGRRIVTLSQTMSRVEAGDLTAKVPDEDRDELGLLGKSFNAMVARLAEAQRHLENRHAEEIRRAENMASLGKMAAGIAHELNNPLAGMQNCARSLLKGVRDEAQRGPVPHDASGRPGPDRPDRGATSGLRA